MAHEGPVMVEVDMNSWGPVCHQICRPAAQGSRMSQRTGLTLIGLGAIGRAIVQRTRDWPEFSLRHVVVTPRSVKRRASGWGHRCRW
jgi:hypothetical protein